MGRDPTQTELLAAVRADLQRGIWSVPLAAGSKRPEQRGWQRLRIDLEAAREHFADGSNRGRLLGHPTRGSSLVDGLIVVDLDTPEAVAMAPRLLSGTPERAGRASCPDCHWYYVCTPSPPTRRFTDPDGTRLIEVLSMGAQVAAPPSVHPSGEPYIWTGTGEAPLVSWETLWSQVTDLAIATLYGRHGGKCEAIANELEALLPEDRLRRIQGALAGLSWTDESRDQDVGNTIRRRAAQQWAQRSA